MGDSRHQTQSLRFRRLRFTADTGAIEQLVRHSITSKNKPHAHHETRLHTMKEVVTILIPSFHGVRLERLGVWPTICIGHTQKKRKKKLSAKANSTNYRLQIIVGLIDDLSSSNGIVLS